MQEDEYKDFLWRTQSTTEYPASPGVIALPAPFEGYLLIISEKCPACVRGRKDSKGKPLKPNIVIEMHNNPYALVMDPSKGLQMMLTAKCIRDIGVVKNVRWNTRSLLGKR